MRINPQHLTDAHQTGDQEAIGRLLLELATCIVNEHIVGRRLIDKHDPDDLVQELAIKAWAALPELHEPSRLFAFTYRVMTQHLLAIRRNAAEKLGHRNRYVRERSYRMRRGLVSASSEQGG